MSFSLTADLSSEASIKAAFEGASDQHPLVPGRLEFIPEGVRVWGSTTNEKYLGWWLNLEPQQFPFYGGLKRASMRYRLKVGANVSAAGAFNSGKWPGMEGTYVLWAESVLPPSPTPNAGGTWEARCYDRYDAATDEWLLGTYFYGVRAPRQFIGADGNPTNTWFPGAVHVDTPGTPTSIAKFYGSGTQGGVPMSMARLKPDVWYEIEQQVIMNSVKDKEFFIDSLYPDAHEAIQRCLDNANEDGILRLLVDDVLVYEATKVAFRGLECVGVQSGNVNIYDGGRGQYPAFEAPYELADISILDQVQGGGTQPMPYLPTQAQKDMATAEAHAAVDALAALVTVGEPVPPPLEQTIEAFVATPASLPVGGGAVDLSWMTSNADAVTLDGEEVDDDGQVMLDVATTTTFTLTAEGVAPLVTQAVTVNVATAPPPVGDLPVPRLPPAPPLPESALGNLINSMPPNSWAELSTALIESVINSASQSGNVIPYSNAAAFDEFNAEIVVVAADHLVQPRVCVYSLETNRWRARRFGPGPAFIHAYQHTACVGGVRYFRTATGLLVDDGSRNWIACAPMTVNLTQIIAVALSVWPAGWPGASGAVILVFDGNSGQLVPYDVYSDTWLPPVTGLTTGLAGVYHVVSAYVPSVGLIFGGGNGGNCPVTSSGAANNRALWKLSADLTSTRMPDAPFHIGIHAGANITACGGHVYALGFGQHWRLDPLGAGLWTRLPDPPADLIEPNAGAGFVSCAVPGGICYVDAGYGIPARMRIYKPG